MPPNKRERRSAIQRMLEVFDKPTTKPTRASETLDDIFAGAKRVKEPGEIVQSDPITLHHGALPLLPNVSEHNKQAIANDEELQRLLSDGTLQGVFKQVSDRVRIVSALILKDVIDWNAYHAAHPDRYPPK